MHLMDVSRLQSGELVLPLALHGLDKLLARIGLAKKSGTFNKQGGHTVSQRTAGRVDDAQVRAKLDGTARQFNSIEAIWPIRHLDVRKQQDDGRAFIQ